MEGSDEEQSLIGQAKNTALAPFRAISSKTAQKAYLGTILFTLASLVLLCISTAAYLLFYYSFVPQIGLERVVHLQFGNGYPHGVAQLGSDLASLQAYDVSIKLQLPRTPANLAEGNFMVDLSLYPRQSNTVLGSNNSFSVLAQARRPAILTYESPLVAETNKIVQMPWYVLGWRKEAETLVVPMMERVEFSKGWRNLPGSLRLEIQSEQKMQVYQATVSFVARFTGLRWIMYNHRIISFLAFTSAFWTVSVLSMATAWLVLFYLFSTTPKVKEEEEAAAANGHAKSAVKTEPSEEDVDVFSTENLSDSQRSFPTLGRQMPLRFPVHTRESPIKREEEDPTERIERTANIEPLVAEADDEDEEEGLDRGRRTDSGIGTSLDELDRRSVQRRRSRPFDGGGAAGGAT